MQNVTAEFTIGQRPPINTIFEINTNPTRVSQLENDLDFQTGEEVSISIENALIPIQDDISSINATINSFGDIVTYNASDFATAAQGLLADSALQPNDNISELTNDVGYITGITSSDVTTALGYTPYNSTNPAGYTTNVGTVISVNSVLPVNGNVTLASSDVGALSDTTTIYDLTTTAQQDALDSGATSTNIGQITTNANDISDIQDLIPNTATTSNQLADQDFVNSSIASNTANFIGTFNSVSDLKSYSGTVTNNDYAFVVNRVVTDNGNDWTTFSSLDAYNKSLLTNFDYAWVINGSNFDLYRFDILLQTWGLRVSNTPKNAVTLNTAYNRYKATVTSNIVTWNYEYTLNNSSFTAVQWAAINSGITSSDVALIGTALQPSDNISQLVNDSGYITGITSTDVTTALGYTPYDSSNPNGYTTNVGTVTSVNNVSPINGNVTLSIPAAQVNSDWNATSGVALILNKPTIPTAVSELNNDSGYITGITGTDVTTALGYTPYNSTNPNGYTSVVESTVSGWGFTKNAGTVTSVNNVSPVNGNVSLTIPTVNNATLTITQGGVSKGTFTANASSDVTIALDSGGGGTWGGITGTLSDQTDLQNALNDKIEYAMVITDYTA